jgi:hypothetical protein
MTDDKEQYLWKRRHSIVYRARLSSLYHRRRERFFELCDRWIKAIAVIGGASTMAKVLDQDALVLTGAIITVSSAIGLVFGLSERARRHAELAADFKKLEAAIVAAGETTFTEAQLAEWESQAVMLESKEPQTLGALVVICQNEIATAENHPDTIVPLKLHQRLLAQWIDLNIQPRRA